MEPYKHVEETIADFLRASVSDAVRFETTYEVRRDVRRNVCERESFEPIVEIGDLLWT